MDTRQLKTLIAIDNCGTFAGAADSVGLTASAVSQQINALEIELNTVLFNRETRPPSLTSHGLQVLEMANEILRLVETTKAGISGERISGTILLGSVRTSALNLIPKAIVKMRTQYPELKTNLRVALSSTLIADVAAGRIDAAVVAEHVGFPPGLRWSPFLREPLWLIASPGTQIDDPIEALKTQPYIRFHSPVPLANLIDTEISRLGVLPQVVAEIDTMASILTCVRRGLGISVVPHIALQEPEDDDLVRLPFGEPQVTLQIGIVERNQSPRGEIIARIHEMLAELCGEYGVRRTEG